VTCLVKQRQRAHALAGTIVDRDGVIDATAIAPGAGPEPGWTVSVVSEGPLEPPALEAVVTYDGRLSSAMQQGTALQALVLIR
jgi:hypothetical protein